MKVIIAGGREFLDYKTLCEKCDNILKNQSDIEIVSGKAKGADSLGEKYAKERGYPVKEFPANWNDVKDKPQAEIRTTKSGKPYWVKAGHFRNEEMAKYGDALISFWDGKSTGTKNMIGLAKKYNLNLRIINY